MTGHGSPARGARGIGRCAPLRARGRTRDQSGQALVPVLAVTVLLLLGVGAVTVVGAGHVAAARAQRVADLAAVSAVRALPRALGDARLPTEGDLRGRLFAAIGPTLHGTGARVEALAFPDASDGSWPPTSVQVRVAVPGPLGVEVRGWAHAGLAVAAGQEGAAGWATGGGYSGPLVRRDGKPACPAVIAAFDLMDAAAHRDGIDLVVTSGFRSDAEQAVLFARHPDPRWVAPPGRSRHRNATELDIGGGRAAWAWLRVHAGRFGFLQRYSWEPWHYGYLPGCGATHGATPGPAGTAESPVGTSERRTRARGGLWGDAVAGADDGAESGASPTPATAGGGLPAWVPVPYRGLVWSSATAGGVPPVVLAALLQAESGFRPAAVSPAGAQGIAQFIPSTAAGVGLRNPFDPAQAIPAAGRLLGGHLRRFRSIPLALAAYNAGPGAVERYGGVPPYRETRAYVARVMALVGGASSGGTGFSTGVVLLPIAPGAAA